MRSTIVIIPTYNERQNPMPITFVERRFGVSKMSPDIVREAVVRVTLWGLRSLPSRLAGRPRPARAGAAEEPAHVTGA